MYSNIVRGIRITRERWARMGKAALNMPVIQMVKTGAKRRSIKVVAPPLELQLTGDIWEEEQELQYRRDEWACKSPRSLRHGQVT
jgi:hypothetical protein